MAFLIGCSGCENTGSLLPTTEAIESVQLISRPGTDLGPEFAYSIEVRDGLVRDRLQQYGPKKSAIVRAVDIRISHERSGQIIQRAKSLPKGYWDREIRCPEVFIGWADRFVVETRLKGEISHRVSTDGLDERLRAAFSDALRTLPTRYRFELPGVDFAIGEKEAEGRFEWRYVGPKPIDPGKDLDLLRSKTRIKEPNQQSPLPTSASDTQATGAPVEPSPGKAGQ